MTLEQRVAKLEAELNAQKDTRSIPRELETALRHRLKVLTGGGASGVYGTLTFSQALTGNAQSIDLLSPPDGYIPIIYEGQIRKVAYWN